MVSVESIMTTNPVFVTKLTNVNRARRLLAEKKIRHLPVKDSESGDLVGMLSQKSVLANAIKIVNQRGFDQLEHHEKSMDVGSIMDKEVCKFDVNTNVLEVAKALKSLRSGCIAIEKEAKLIGVVTSSDFVDLAINQLSDK